MTSPAKQSYFNDPAWLNALTLRERAELLRSAEPTCESGNGDATRRLIERWRSQPCFADGSLFAQRLEVDRLTEEQFTRLLGEPSESLYQLSRGMPGWVNELELAFSSEIPAARDGDPGEHQPETAQNQLALPTGIGSLTERGKRRLREGIKALRRQHCVVPFDPETVEELFAGYLPQLLFKIANRTLVLELNVARLQGLLEGETPEERFWNFGTRLAQRDVMLSLLREYPVLARQLVVAISQWADFSLQFLGDLCGGWQAIRAAFFPDDPGKLSAISPGAGDTHREGRSVVIASFSSGAKLVYKPRSLSVDVHFGELLKWVNERGDHPLFRSLSVLDCGSHGWVEFVPVRGCTDSDEIERFYMRQGGYLALLYVLEATDFHLENLIAAGEHPVLVDLEALFHPRVGAGDASGQPGMSAARVMAHSVLRVGLLPQRIWFSAESDGIELSGLGGAPGQLTPHQVPTFEADGTDEMRIVRKRVPLAGGQNRPSLNGSEVDPQDYIEAIIAGFTCLYRLLQEHREELLAAGGQIAQFRDDEVRVVLRPTRNYGLILMESYHPDVLRNALDRDRLLDSLWADVKKSPALSRIIPAEQADLLRGDIPLFNARPSSRDLWTSTNDRIADFFDEASITMVERRLRDLSDADLFRQTWFIRASISTLATESRREPWKGYRPVDPKVLAEPPHLLEAARAVGDRLHLLAIRDQGSVSWIGLTLVNDRAWSLLPLAEDLYGGTLGIAFFLGYLGVVTQEERYTDLARSVVTNVREQVRSRLSRNQAGAMFPIALGGFGGLGGVIYTLSHLGALWGDSDLLADAESIVEHLPRLIDRDDLLDIVGGVAGCIGGLISLYQRTGSNRAMGAAAQCAEHLLTRAEPQERGIAWRTPIEGGRPLTGFSHGAAGMAWALLEVAALRDDARLRVAALDAMAYERSQFSSEAGNWPDFRALDTKSSLAESSGHNFVASWCHGAPGIGLARLRSLSHIDDEDIRSEIDAALNTTLRKGFGSNHSLCHGDLGNLEPLLEASLRADGSEWREPVSRIASVVLESIKAHGWLCGVPFGVETPGLMTGLAGIGYGLLRLAEPKRVPSVLSLAPPPMSG
jgi:type 2 lantibiotic biosynthesis protein LanM